MDRGTEAVDAADALRGVGVSSRARRIASTVGRLARPTAADSALIVWADGGTSDGRNDRAGTPAADVAVTGGSSGDGPCCVREPPPLPLMLPAWCG